MCGVAYTLLLRRRDGRLGFIEEDRAKIWKELIEKIMNEENEWDHVVEADVVKRPMKKMACNETVEEMQKIKSGKTTGPSEVSLEMIVASSESNGGTVPACVGWWRNA